MVLTESIRVWKAMHCVARDGLVSFEAGKTDDAVISTSSVVVSIGEDAVCCTATLMMFLERRSIKIVLVDDTTRTTYEHLYMLALLY